MKYTDGTQDLIWFRRRNEQNLKTFKGGSVEVVSLVPNDEKKEQVYNWVDKFKQICAWTAKFIKQEVNKEEARATAGTS